MGTASASSCRTTSIDYETGSCRWNDKIDQEGTIAVSKWTEICDVFCWINTNWIIVCVVIVASLACCICFCAIMQKFKKSKLDQIDTANTGSSWHGGNSAFR